jgi:hypothetical protein
MKTIFAYFVLLAVGTKPTRTEGAPPLSTSVLLSVVGRTHSKNPGSFESLRGTYLRRARRSGSEHPVVSQVEDSGLRRLAG